MLQRFQQLIRQQHLFPPGQEVLLAVSGGRDSVVLTHLVAASRIPFAIAHCNFHLRPGDCDRDEAFVRSLAQTYGVSCYVADFDTNSYAADNHLSVEEAARKLRYRFFLQLAEQHHYAAVATAHHRDDSVETFFINLVRGTGINGLRGIPLRNGIVVRPLLPFSRSQIDSYVQQHNLAFVEDATNAQPLYLRNRIRLQLMPLLRDIAPAFDQTMCDNLSRFASDADIVSDAVRSVSSRLLVPLDGGYRIEVAQLQQLPHFEAYLFHILHPFGFSQAVTDEVLSALDAQSGKQFFSQSHILVKDRDALLLRPIAPADAEPRQCTILSPDHCNSLPTPLTMTVRPNSGETLRMPPSSACFDLDRVLFPLALRPWRSGDRFVPFGMKGSRLVSDLLSDKKINILDKRNILILADANDTILWVVGLRAANVATVTRQTRSILQVTLNDTI